MKKTNGLQTILPFLILTAMMIAVSSCVGDQGVSKSRGLVKDFSKTSTNKNGCGDKFLIYETPDTCTLECNTGSHLATTEELETVKAQLVADNDTTLLTIINNSANICVADVKIETRPTNAIDIKSNFCACINGKSDLINDCESFCASKSISDRPILYVNTIIGTEIALNAKLGNLYNWCSVQLINDDSKPQCAINASDGSNSINLPVNITPGSNSFNVDILSLAKDRTWILKLVESKAGSNAQSKEFQIRRKTQPSSDTTIQGALKVTPISQYSCLLYGKEKTTFARNFYYFAANETPPPIPPAGGTNQSLVVCHDEQLHPGNDSAEYNRFEHIPNALAMWDKADTRFVAKAENAGKLTINKILEDRLSSEFNITGSTIGLFFPISYANRPSTSAPLGYIMVYFTNPDTGKTYCPTSAEYNGSQPLLNLLGEYMDDTEGLFVAQKEAETILSGTTYTPIYGTMLVRESILKSYGFYIENGLKIKADAASMNTKTIYYYWPASTTADPLTQGNRKLFTVRTPDTLSGNVPTGQSTTERSTDKRIGCVPKS